MKHMPEVHVNSQSYQTDPHGNKAFPVAFYEGDLVTHPVPWHWHDELEAVYVARGNIRVGAGTVSAVMHEGDGCMINTGVLHSVRKADDQHCVYHSAVFHSSLIGSPESIFWTKYIRPLMSPEFPQCILLRGAVPAEKELLTAFENAWQRDETEDPGYEIEVRYWLTMFLRKLTETSAGFPQQLTKRDRRDMERMKTMLSWIDDHYSDPVSVPEIAESTGISESECLRCFKRNVGSSPSRYLISYRLRKAADMMKTTGYNISEIASSCGFLDMSYFSRLFRQYYGITPTEYIRNNTEY